MTLEMISRVFCTCIAFLSTRPSSTRASRQLGPVHAPTLPAASWPATWCPSCSSTPCRTTAPSGCCPSSAASNTGGSPGRTHRTGAWKRHPSPACMLGMRWGPPRSRSSTTSQQQAAASPPARQPVSPPAHQPTSPSARRPGRTADHGGCLSAHGASSRHGRATELHAVGGGPEQCCFYGEGGKSHGKSSWGDGCFGRQTLYTNWLLARIIFCRPVGCLAQSHQLDACTPAAVMTDAGPNARI